MNVKAPTTSSPLRWGPVTGLLVLLLVYAWATQTGRVGYRGVLTAEPGTHHVLSLFEVSDIGEGSYELSRGQLSFTVLAEPSGLEVGQELTAEVVVEEPGLVTEEWRRIAPGRAAKKQLGVLGLVLVTIIGLATVRMGTEGVSFRG